MGIVQVTSCSRCKAAEETLSCDLLLELRKNMLGIVVEANIHTKEMRVSSLPGFAMPVGLYTNT